ncbi:hypothetical protein [Cryptosporangium japonicum]|uniref:Ig-like domain-containing protein n=1 Tax=Cryptosporangium japonicum TaxID=80872 RepID=A0ABN0UQV7_9ACTN
MQGLVRFRPLTVVAGFAVAVALVGVPAPAFAATPTITTQPVVEAGPTGSDIELTVGANSTDAGTLNYQWFYELIKGTGIWVKALPSAEILNIGYTGGNTDTLKLKTVTPVLNAIGLKVEVSSSLGGGAATSDEVGVAVGDPPTIVGVGQVEPRVVAGGTAHLTGTVTGLSPLSYSWQVLKPALVASRWTSLTNGSGVSGARTATLTLSNLTADVAKNSYRLVASNAVGIDISEPVKVDVGVKPTVSTPADQTAVNGSATLTSTITGNPTPSVKWQRRSGALWTDVVSSATSLTNGVATAKLTGLTTADNGAQYRVVASNNFGESAESGAVTVTVAGSKPTITDPLDKISLLGGVNLSVNVTGDPAPVVTWQRKLPTTGAVWEDLTGVGTTVSTGAGSLVSTLPLSALTSALSGSRFRAVAKNAVDTVVSDSSQLIAGLAPTVTNPLDVTVSSGAGTLAVNVTGDPAPTVTWQRRGPSAGAQWEDLIGQGTVSGGVATLPLTGVTSALNGSRYRAVVKNAVGQVVSDSAQLISGTVADVSNPVAQTATLGAATFTANVSGDPLPTARWQVLEPTSGARWANVSVGSGVLAAQVGGLATLTLTGLTKNQNGNRYRVVATNGVDTPAVSDSAVLTVAGTPLSITNPASAVTSALNGTVTLAVNASGGDTPPSVQWQSLAPTVGSTWTNLSNGAGVAGANTSQLTLSALTALRNGYRYRAVATNGSETATSSSSLLTVNIV